MSASAGKKRVRFSTEHEVHSYVKDDPDDDDELGPHGDYDELGGGGDADHDAHEDRGADDAGEFGQRRLVGASSSSEDEDGGGGGQDDEEAPGRKRRRSGGGGGGSGSSGGGGSAPPRLSASPRLSGGGSGGNMRLSMSPRSSGWLHLFHGGGAGGTGLAPGMRLSDLDDLCHDDEEDDDEGEGGEGGDDEQEDGGGDGDDPTPQAPSRGEALDRRRAELRGELLAMAAEERGQRRRECEEEAKQEEEEGAGGEAAAQRAEEQDERQQGEEDNGDDDEPRFNDAGIPIEPFNLRRERREGVFDAATGAYVPHHHQGGNAPSLSSQRLRRRGRRRDGAMFDEALDGDEGPGGAGVEDAWLAQLERDERRRAAEGQAAQEAAPAPSRAPIAPPPPPPPQPPLQPQQLRPHLAALIGALRPGEDAVAALRRLGATRPAPAAAAAAGPADALPPLPAESAAALATITAACDALMAGGVLAAYSTAREKLVEQLGGGEGDVDMAAAPTAAEEEDGEAPAAAPAPPRPLSAGVLDGFQPTPTGRLENAELGYVFDPATGLFGDAATGRWFRREAGTGVFSRAEG